MGLLLILKYVVNHGIAPYLKEMLENEVKISDWFVGSFDESLNDVTQTSEMDICIRFWNKENNRVEDRYRDSQFLGHTTHQHLLDSIQEGLKVFDMTEMVQLSMDGPNVNLKLFTETETTEKRTWISRIDRQLVAAIYTPSMVPSKPVLKQVDGI